MQIQSKLNDDVAYVIKGFISPFNRFKMLRDTYSNRYFKSGFEKKKYKQLELIHSKLVQIINDEFGGFEYFFNTIGINVESLKHKPIIYCENLYSWRYVTPEYSWTNKKPKIKKTEIIKKIVDIIQRLDDVVSLKHIECLRRKYYYNGDFLRKIVVEENKLSISYQYMFTEGATKILCLLAYITKK